MISLIAFPVLVAVIYAALTASAEATKPLPVPAVPLQLTASFRPPPPPPPIPPPARPVWHPELSNDRDEQRLLEALRARPDDAETRMVYGDWLESRGELAKAQFVRGAPLTPDEHDLIAAVDPGWRAITSCAGISCTRPTCPRRWSELAASPVDESSRSCAACEHAVRYCATLVQLYDAKRRGELIVDDVITPSPPRQRLDFDVSDRAD